MKKRIKIILLFSLAIVVVAVGICAVYLESTNQTTMAGRCLVSTNGKYLIVKENGMPIVMKNELEDLFDDLRVGNLVSHITIPNTAVLGRYRRVLFYLFPKSKGKTAMAT